LKPPTTKWLQNESTLSATGEKEVPLVDFTGHRSSDLQRDEAMHCVDHDLAGKPDGMVDKDP